MDLFNQCLAQATPPAPPSPTELIQLFRDSHAQLTTSFNLFVGAISTIFALVGIFLGFVGIRTRQELQQTIQEIKLSVAEQVRSEVDRQIAAKVDEEIGHVKNMVGREAAIGRTTVEYVFVDGQPEQHPIEYKLLKARGFQMAPFNYDPNRPWPDSHVFVLDLVTPTLSPERKEALVAEVARKLTEQRRQGILVIYVKGRIEAVYGFPEDFNYILSNMRGTLIGAVVDAAQIAHSLRNQAM
ncbi:MAG: hypothetical protein EA342_14340 [Leptolyngbya sp. LCM1.Bin17]|nr:MAG: hypothetical protein EA342_14340 [Leptolyngbya sp. LCM1.Bin17]